MAKLSDEPKPDITVSHDLEHRILRAQQQWDAGDRHLAAGELDLAWRAYTDAHDQVTDCPQLHRRAHEKLRGVNRLNGHRGEYLTDVVLLALAPLGVFELIAVFFRSRVAGDAPCRHSQVEGR